MPATFTGMLFISIFCVDGSGVGANRLCDNNEPAVEIELSILNSPDCEGDLENCKFETIAELRVNQKVIGSIPAEKFNGLDVALKLLPVFQPLWKGGYAVPPTAESKKP